jgi:hypothetical protein
MKIRQHDVGKPAHLRAGARICAISKHQYPASLVMVNAALRFCRRGHRAEFVPKITPSFARSRAGLARLFCGSINGI